MKIAREGWPLIALFAGLSAMAAAGALYWLGVWGWLVVGAGLLLTGWCVWFFRDPDRTTPDLPGSVISPADGVVCQVADAPYPPELGGEGNVPRVCVFMNVFNVHVNRVPCAGTIEQLEYVKGSFVNASFDKASTHNERMAISMKTRSGHRVAFVQIAGLVARRIVCRLKLSQEVAAGERFGLIRFGSRVDVYLPKGSEIVVAVGQKTTAGETLLARLPGAVVDKRGA